MFSGRVQGTRPCSLLPRGQSGMQSSAIAILPQKVPGIWAGWRTSCFCSFTRSLAAQNHDQTRDRWLLPTSI